MSGEGSTAETGPEVLASIKPAAMMRIETSLSEFDIMSWVWCMSCAKQNLFDPERLCEFSATG